MKRYYTLLPEDGYITSTNKQKLRKEFVSWCKHLHNQQKEWAEGEGEEITALKYYLGWYDIQELDEWAMNMLKVEKIDCMD